MFGSIGGLLGSAVLMGIGIRLGADAYNYMKLKALTARAVHLIDQLPQKDKEELLGAAPNNTNNKE